MNRRHLTVVCTAILLVSTATPALGTTPSAEFDTGVVETPAGETVEIPITLSNTDTATVKVGSEAVNYVAVVVVHDNDDDQSVTLQYDTSSAGHGGAFATTSDADAVTVESETEFKAGQFLDPGTYDLAVAPGDDGIGNESDVATLMVTEQSASETTTSAPGPHAGHVATVEGGVVVAPARNQTITGQSDLEPGTEMTVRVRSTEVSFLKSNTATVTEDGRFRVSFDFDDLSTRVQNGTEFEIELRTNGTFHREVTGVFRTPPTSQETTTAKRTTQDDTSESTTDSRDGSETTASDGSETSESTTDSSVGSIPGFGPVTGLLALVALTLVGLRRGT